MSITSSGLPDDASDDVSARPQLLRLALVGMDAAKENGVSASIYANYADVPFYRRQWFFWLTWLIFAPIAVGVLVTGDVYYVKKREVRAFGKANRIVAGIIALIWSAGLLNALISQNVFRRVQQEGVMKATRQTAPAAAESREIIEPQVQAWRQPPEGSVLTHEDDAQAVERYRKAAEQGDAAAQSNLGWAYANGRGVPQDYTQAAQWYRKAAEQGNAFAQFNLGLLYEGGSGVPPDDAQATHWYRKAAEQGNAFAQHNLGVHYAEGRGVKQDDAQAVQWWSKAAEQGHADAQSNLGWAYANGRGVKQDDLQAVQWLRKAAEQGHTEAQFNLGWAYQNGRGVPQNDVEAHRWMNLAAARTSGADQKRFANERDAVAKKMTPDQLSEAQKRAGEWTEGFARRKP